MEFPARKKISIGDIFMINSKYFEKFVKLNYEDDDFSMEVFDYKKINENGEGILFIVKYIGDGKIQEMLTGEVINIDANGLSGFAYLEDNERLEEYGDFTPCTVATRLEAYDNITLEQYINRCNVWKKIMNKSPLIYSFRTYDLTEDNKKEYLKYSDEQRIQVISHMMMIAKQSRDEVISEMDAVIDSYMHPSNETTKMAYLENQLYDFENKERSK